jgi:CHAT domain-containing protein
LALTLAFLNGCRTSEDIAGITQMNGWASGFIGAGAAAFIGSLWAAWSAAAQAFAAEFYGALIRDRATLAPRRGRPER